MNNNVLDYSQGMLDHYIGGNDVDNFGGKWKEKRAKKKAAKKEMGGKAFRKQKRDKRKEKIKEFGGKMKNAVKKYGAVGVLIPFKNVMVKRLQEMGVNVKGKSLQEIAVDFYNKVVKKDNYEEIDHLAVPPSIIAGVVQGILGFFKNLVKRKKQGDPLSPAEEKMATGVEKVADQVDEAERDITEESIGELVVQYLPYAILAGIAIYIFTKK